jgi:CxxC motif-containing protein (DUF1111 family)
LTSAQSDFFNNGRTTFMEHDTVSAGLGPRFNTDSCAACHAFPDVGGSSPPTNPEASFANSANKLPSFITADGPVREARFVSDGGVHDLFTIDGLPGAGSCALTQPDFATAVATKNVIFRIPTPTFGAGLIAAIPDSTILNNMKDNESAKASLGISGRPNTSGNDGSITRFGWKAQNKSLEVFAGEAYNVEQGVTNEIFPNEREETCSTNALPEDFTGKDGTGALSDVTQFSLFMQLLAPPTPGPANPFTSRGSQVFNLIGCNLCHTQTLKTGKSSTGALSGVNANLYSDLLLHNMGSGLSDGISQGIATGDEFRTAPLWGVGQRLFFMHDGRSKDLVDAIKQHDSPGSEASGVVAAYSRLNQFDQEAVILFLRSL